TAAPVSGGSCSSWLLNLHKLNGNAIRPFNHGRAHVAPWMNLFEELDAFALQPCHGPIEVRDAQRPVIDEVATRADETAAGPRANGNRDVVEEHRAGRIPDEAGLGERRPQIGR